MRGRVGKSNPVLVAQNSVSSCPCQIGRYWGSTPTNSPSSLQYWGVCFCLAPLLQLKKPVCVSHFVSVSFSLVFPLAAQFSAFHKGGKKNNPISEMHCFLTHQSAKPLQNCPKPCCTLVWDGFELNKRAFLIIESL